MKKFAILLTVVGLSAAAPFASASSDGIEEMPAVGGAEITTFVRDEAPAPAVKSDSAFYNLGTGGVSPQ